MNGISYYRLVQTDYDGHSQRFSPTVVNNVVTGLFSIYPNPAKNGKVHLVCEKQSSLSAITVQDITGKIIPSEVTYNDNGSADLEIDEKYTLKGGIFIVTASDGLKIVRHKLLIN